MDINRVLLAGRLSRDPELKEIKPGMFVCKFAVATEYSYLKKDAAANATYEKEVCFVDVTLWNKIAQKCGEILKKGSKVTVDGRLKLEKWIDKTSAVERTKITVQAENVFFLDSKQSEDNLTPAQANTRNFVNEELNKTSKRDNVSKDIPLDTWDTDLPF